MPGKKDPKTLDLAVKLYLEKRISAKSAGEQAGCSECTVLRELARRGINVKETNIREDITDAQKNQIIEMYNNGFSSTEISHQVGRSNSSVCRILKKLLAVRSARRRVSEMQTLRSEWSCVVCCQTKKMAEFPLNSRRCRECKNKRARDYQKENSKKLKENHREWFLRFRSRIDEIKQGACYDCGVSGQPSFCMEFDHLPENGKTMAVSEMISRHWTMDRILEEISKCNLVCVLCHRNRTYYRAKEKSRLQSNLGLMSTRSTPALQRQFKKRQEGRAFLWKQKESPCKDCGKKYNPWQMDYDHLPEHKKTTSVGKLTNCSEKHILKEIAKCDLVCVFCHRIRTHNRLLLDNK